MRQTIRRGGIETAEGFLFELSGGDLSLDFANTVDSRPTRQARELLPTYRELLSWSRQTELLTRQQETHFLKTLSRRPKAAESARRRAVLLRECLFEVFKQVTDDAEIPAGLLKKWNGFVHRSMDHYEMVRSKQGFSWHCRSDAELDSILWPIVHSAVELLTGPNAPRVRRCAARNCDWLFLDTSKRGNRRWCDMTVCGNRAKAQRFYSRKKTRAL
jgi:predicted RNA-binding Zn ribbon-like protein